MSSQTEFVWLADGIVLAVLEAQIAQHGGALGVRDTGLLESALARPRNSAAHTDADVAMLGALYALGIIRNHPFLDGNKRVGTVLMETFMELNGWELMADDRAMLAAIVAVASSGMRDDQFIDWVRAHARKRG